MRIIFKGDETNPSCSPLPVSYFTSQIQDVLLHGLSHLSLAGVDMRHGLDPGFGVGQRQIDDIASLDVPGVEECSQNGEKGTCILQVCIRLTMVAPAETAEMIDSRIGTVLVL
jgi:hypothetical protein